MQTVPHGHAMNAVDAALQQGAQMHSYSHPEQALLAFNEALALQPTSLEAASACAAMLTELGRPFAALRALIGVEQQLLQHADGAANLAIAAENCGDLQRASAAYQRALELAPGHLRSLNNLGLLAASQSRWDEALRHARHCLELEPGHAPYHVNLIDYLCGAHQYREASGVLDNAETMFPDQADLLLRRITTLAFMGQCGASLTLQASLHVDGRDQLQRYLDRLLAPPDVMKSTFSDMPVSPDPLHLYTRQAFAAQAELRWQDTDLLTATLKKSLASASETAFDWRAVRRQGLTLDIAEAEWATTTDLPVASSRTPQADIMQTRTATMPPWRKDARIQIGIAIAGPEDAEALLGHLPLHDASRFAIHVYSTNPQPADDNAARLAKYSASSIEIAHMTPAEAAGRLRLDGLDIFVDATPAWAGDHAAIAALRVAPVQIRSIGAHRRTASPWDYTISDKIIHPDVSALSGFGPIIRLPETCWLANATHDEPPAAASRSSLGLADDAPLLCCVAAPGMLDPFSFGVWMKILRALPDAQLWLPVDGHVAAANLRREAASEGVNPERLILTTRHAAINVTSLHLGRADLFLDSLRVSACGGLQDALRAGVPAIGFAGGTMASRLGASMLHAAGMGDCVMESQDAYVAKVLELIRHPDSLSALRARVQNSWRNSKLFNARARVQEWEMAWSRMAERARAGLPPEGFDVPPAD